MVRILSGSLSYAVRNLADVLAGKQWHVLKSAFRPKAGQSSYARRSVERKTLAATKAKEKDMKDTKEAERQVHVWEGSWIITDG